MMEGQSLDLHALRQRVGGTVYDGGRRWVGPGPQHSRSDASLSVWVTDAGRPVIHSFAGDAFPDCIKHLGIQTGAIGQANRRDLAQARQEREAAERRRRDADQAFCRAVWEGAQPIPGTLAETYLWSRGLVLEGCGDLRFHPAAPRAKRPADADPPPPSPLPAMVALVRDPKGEPTAIHATYLAPDGGKAFGKSRLMFGQTRQSAVRLERPRNGELAIAEGIENAASFTLLHSLPTWAALSTSGLQGFMPPPGVRRLTIAADADENGAGMRAAEALADRVKRVCAVVIMAPEAGGDWNEVLREVSK